LRAVKLGAPGEIDNGNGRSDGNGKKKRREIQRQKRGHGMPCPYAGQSTENGSIVQRQEKEKSKERV